MSDGGDRPRVAVIPGDDAAPEAMAATMSVLESMHVAVDFHHVPAGAALARLGRAERDAVVREAIDGCDTALFGASSGSTSAILYLRWGRDTYANVRPIRWRPGVPTPLRAPEGIDYVIVRENLEDVYAGIEGDLDVLRDAGLDLRGYAGLLGITPTWMTGAGRFGVKVVTRENTERVARFAGQLARRRQADGHPGRITCGTKRNIAPRTDGFFADTVRDVVTGQFPDLEYEAYLADDLGRRLVADPAAFDVVVLPNLFGDLLSDVGAATVGGLGTVPSGCYGDGYAYFEPVHGTAPDIAGRHAINPVATLLSAALMLAHLGLTEEGARLEGAVDAALASGKALTPDLGGRATTEELTDAVREHLE
ncbi:MAG TPA: isocitrate/isopropylmalate family dehydrogenase [Acidimicrobiales bacterium]|nr:isocitrate/isopropylmalate family dehydrogenase [Acidimicrobiales bacterium]